MEYDPENKCFLLDDGKSLAAVFELSDVASEARPDSFLEQLQKGLQGLFQDVFPQYFDNESPWVIQFYVQDELSLKSSAQDFQNYIKPAARISQFSNEYFKLISDHFSLLSQPQGLFVDTKLSGLPFCGRQRKICAVIYRKLNNSSKLRRGRNAADDLNTIAQSFTAKLEGCGVKVSRYTGKEFYEWMVRWFNPSPKVLSKRTNKKNAAQTNLEFQHQQHTHPLPYSGEGWGEGVW